MSPLSFFSAARTRDRPSHHRVTVDQDGTTANDDVVTFKSGYGVKNYANGDLYSGEWESNKQHGFGVYTWAIGDV